jgi:hypothetical protein
MQVMSALTVDHRFALGSPALVRAPSKKINLQRQLSDLGVQRLTSTAGVPDAVLPDPKTSDAPPSSWAFHVVI